MGSNLVSNTLSVLAGASLGAIATYLLDPEQGDARRQNIASSAAGAASTTTDAVNSHLQRAADAARTVASKLGKYAEQTVGHVSDHLSDAADEIHGHAKAIAGHVQSAKDSINDRVQDAKDGLNDRVNDIADSANAAYGRAKKSAYAQANVHESHPIATATGISIGAVGVAAIGAGVMYFMDPVQGRRRRATITDQFFSLTRRTGHSARSYGRHLGNQFKGYAHEVRSAVPEQWTQAVDHATDAVQNAANKFTESKSE